MYSMIQLNIHSRRIQNRSAALQLLDNSSHDSKLIFFHLAMTNHMYCSYLRAIKKDLFFILSALQMPFVLYCIALHHSAHTLYFSSSDALKTQLSANLSVRIRPDGGFTTYFLDKMLQQLPSKWINMVQVKNSDVSFGLYTVTQSSSDALKPSFEGLKTQTRKPGLKSGLNLGIGFEKGQVAQVFGFGQSQVANLSFAVSGRFVLFYLPRWDELVRQHLADVCRSSFFQQRSPLRWTPSSERTKFLVPSSSVVVWSFCNSLLTGIRDGLQKIALGPECGSLTSRDCWTLTMSLRHSELLAGRLFENEHLQL